MRTQDIDAEWQALLAARDGGAASAADARGQPDARSGVRGRTVAPLMAHDAAAPTIARNGAEPSLGPRDCPQATQSARDLAWVPGTLSDLFGPILAPPVAQDGCRVAGRLCQTLDGRIATACGSSQWIGGPGDILHTHRLRALCHAVIVGAGTVAADDPRLTTREVCGPNPTRIILDPTGRLPVTHQVFTEGPPTILVTCVGDATHHGSARVLRLPAPLDLPLLLTRLAAMNLTRIFVEGGGITVSRFLAAGCLDRLHVTIAPVILGSGIPAFTLPQASRIGDGLRASFRVFPMDPDILLDMPLDRARPTLCR
ncbi:MAG: riboflavin biosynthesis protein RibD [Rhodospirillales bacterium]|jgi:diaminohydroxyphosphoribosylaminopyrimidine deaminase/5-amino-6-(5-phosphoribosylamino)uracil reductase|nr:riboflavin biosynthesis protein RibD [Rhodospirillales bacterium]MDB5383375.1 riboflavin biosynthesis protein RibD [Rhodospirillales bacterium]